jgi:hypothetical protein
MKLFARITFYRKVYISASNNDTMFKSHDYEAIGRAQGICKLIGLNIVM